MSSDTIKKSLQAKLERQTKAVTDTKAQLDWILELEAKAASQKPR